MIACGKVGSLWIYPLKSFPGISVDTAVLLPRGGLQWDRAWALFDADGRVFNAKRTPEVHYFEWDWLWSIQRVEIRDRRDGTGGVFHWESEQVELARWLSERLNLTLTIRENIEQGFPDDAEASGPTMISTPTLARITDWFPGLTVENTRGRFRANIELVEVSPFGEDRLFGIAGKPVPFKVGDAELAATNPCQRCVVPSRDPESGVVISGFSKTFSQHREAELPSDVERSRFNHFYRLAVNTIHTGTEPCTIRVGDPVFSLSAN